MPVLARRVSALPFTPDEQIIFRIRQSSLLLILQLIGLGLLGFAVFAVFRLLPPDTTPIFRTLTLTDIIRFGVLVAVGFVALIRLLDYATTSYILTTRRVQKDFGIFLRTSYAVPLSHIESLNIRQSILGRILNYGDVIARPKSTAISFVTFQSVTDPGTRREQIENQLP